MKNKQVVVVADSAYNKATAFFDSVEDFHLIVAPEEENVLAEIVSRENAFGVILGTYRYTGLLYEKMKSGGVLARFGVGCDGLDFNKAKEKNQIITNTPGVLDQTVAEFTVFLAAEVLRKIGHVDRLMKQEKWNTHLGNDLNGKTWLILGLGNIGKKLAGILNFGFGARVLALSRRKYENEDLLKNPGVAEVYTDFHQAVSRADIISLHLPANSDTWHFLDRSRLKQINRHAILINTARGSLIDEEALYDTLYEGKISGAGLDVFESEPYTPKSETKDLRKLHNVVLSPHLASSTVECCNRMAASVMSGLRFAANGEFNRMNRADLL